MNDARSATGAGAEAWRFPWVLFSLVFVLLFLIGHEVRYAEHYELILNEADPSSTVAAIIAGSLRRQVAGLALGAIGILSLFLPGRRPSRLRGFLPGLILCFLAWNYLSILWSADPLLSMRRLIVLAVLVLGALAVAERTWPKHLMLFTLLMTGGYLAIGIGTEAALGTLRPLAWHYRFCGTIHPNTQAINCALLFLSALYLSRDAKSGWRLVLLAVAAVALAFMFFTKSRAGLAGTATALVTYWVLARSGSGRLLIVFTTLTAVGLLFLFGAVLLPLLRKGVDLGRERSTTQSLTTLTGRVPLWQDCLLHVRERPLLGYGYDAFWNPERTAKLTESQGWVIAQGHNVYIDLALQVGPVGLIAFVMILFAAIARALALHRATGEANYAFLGTLLTFCLLGGLLDSLVLQRTILTFVVMYALIALAFQAPPVAARSVAAHEKHGANAVPSAAATANTA